ncbi:MAG: nucleotidyltransferase [Candidatus Nanohalarchaeota archaeon]|nr:MAG: nucleotidyltransferase [Candidatus Nanohaloarchaeota archaeon]
MKEVEQIIMILGKDKQNLRKKYGVKKVGVFGSYVRGEQKRKSDLDLLIDFKEPVSLFEFLELERHLSELTDKKVDLVMKSALKPRIGRHITREVVYV